MSSTVLPSLDGLYSDFVNPQWVKPLNILPMNVPYERCTAAELFTTDGRRILDFLSGYVVSDAQAGVCRSRARRGGSYEQLKRLLE